MPSPLSSLRRTRMNEDEAHSAFGGSRGSSRAAKDSVAQYLDEIGRYPLLSSEEETELGRRARKGGSEAEAAVDWMIKCNLRLVVRICKDFTRNTFSLMDLVSVGNEGLIVACRKFDPALGVPLANYSAIWVKQRVMKWVAERGLPIKIPSYRAAIVNQVLREFNRLQSMMHRPPTAEEIAEEMRLQRGEDGDQAPSAAEVEEVLCLLQPSMELDAPVSDESGSTTMGAFFGESVEDSNETLTSRLGQIDMERFVEQALSLLTEREAQVVEWSFGLKTGRPMDLEQIGIRLGVTRERARQIRTAAIKKLSTESSLLQYVD